MFLRKPNEMDRVIGLVEEDGGYLPIVFKLKNNGKDGEIRPVDMNELTINEKEDFYRLVRNTELSKIPLKKTPQGERVVVGAVMEVEGVEKTYPAFISEDDRPVVVDTDLLTESELKAYNDLLEKDSQ